MGERCYPGAGGGAQQEPGQGGGEDGYGGQGGGRSGDKFILESGGLRRLG